MITSVLSRLRRTPAALSRTVEVGWALDTPKAGFIWEAPTRLTRGEQPRGKHAKALTFCPAMIDHEARLFQVTCPVDLHIRFAVDEKTKQPGLVNAAGDASTIRPKALGDMVSLVSQKEWRDPAKPIVQVTTPYLFVADEPVYMTQLPPFNHFAATPWPGLLIGGRFPIHIWPRHLMWAFEWHDTRRDLVLRRGEPWFYVRFEATDPSRPVRLVEAEITPTFREYLAGLTAVTNYVNRTFSLFDTAKQRRPKKLLTPKVR